MKKQHQVRIRSNVSTATVEQQAENPVAIRQPVCPITLQLLAAGADKPLACVEITANELSHIKAGYAALSERQPPGDCSFEEWIKSAVLHQANRELRESPLLDLEEAVNKIVGILSLMVNSSLKLQADLENEDGIEDHRKIAAGIELLASSASSELLYAFDASYDYAVGLSKEAA